MPRLLSTSTISQPRPLPRPPLPFTLSCILRLLWKHNQGPCSSPCLVKKIGMTFLCWNVPGFCQQPFTLFFLVSTNSSFPWNLYFRIPNLLCFIRLGVPLASNPNLLSFCTLYANDFANPASPVLIPVFLFLNGQWRGGGGRWGGVKCERVEAMFNPELTSIGPRPNLILFDPLHCYKNSFTLLEITIGQEKHTAGPHTPPLAHVDVHSVTIQFHAKKPSLTGRCWKKRGGGC
jgi:hypothetical protein